MISHQGRPVLLTLQFRPGASQMSIKRARRRGQNCGENSFTQLTAHHRRLRPRCLDGQSIGSYGGWLPAPRPCRACSRTRRGRLPSMKFSEITVLLPCHSLEDFPTYHEGSEADELLAAWTTPWHPALLADAGVLPTFHRLDVPPESLSGRLMVIPSFCLERLPAGYPARAESDGGLLVRVSNRDEATAAALAALPGGAARVDERLAADFQALGFARLQIELLTRQMRYSVNIDETHFQNEAVAAARAAAAGDETTARAHLSQCFDTLYEARKRFYPVDVYLLDLLLLAPRRLANRWRANSSRPRPPTGWVRSTCWRRFARRDAAVAEPAGRHRSGSRVRRGGRSGRARVAALAARNRARLVAGRRAALRSAAGPGPASVRPATCRPVARLAPTAGQARLSGSPAFHARRRTFSGRAAIENRAGKGSIPTPWTPTATCPTTRPSRKRSWACRAPCPTRWTTTTWPRSRWPVGPAPPAPGSTICGAWPR